MFIWSMTQLTCQIPRLYSQKVNVFGYLRNTWGCTISLRKRFSSASLDPTWSRPRFLMQHTSWSFLRQCNAIMCSISASWDLALQKCPSKLYSRLRREGTSRIYRRRYCGAWHSNCSRWLLRTRTLLGSQSSLGLLWLFSGHLVDLSVYSSCSSTRQVLSNQYTISTTTYVFKICRFAPEIPSTLSTVWQLELLT